jgi:hypothetical protein
MEIQPFWIFHVQSCQIGVYIRSVRYKPASSPLEPLSDEMNLRSSLGSWAPIIVLFPNYIA